MKIASYVNIHGAVAGFQEKGQICLYERDTDGWLKTREVPLALHPDLSLSEIKAGIRHAVAQLDDCKVFVVREVRGGLNAVLQEEFGFRTWKSEGSLVEQLDSVARHDQEIIAEQAAPAAGHTCGTQAGRSGCGDGCSSRPSAPAPGMPDISKPLPVPESLGNGRYRINLAYILASDSSLNSKQVLVPFMAEVAFKQLEVLCDHPPRWFARELYKLDLRVSSKQPDSSGRGVRVLVVPITAEAVPADHEGGTCP